MNLSFLSIIYSAKPFPAAGTVQALLLAAQKVGINLTPRKAASHKKNCDPPARKTMESSEISTPKLWTAQAEFGEAVPSNWEH